MPKLILDQYSNDKRYRTRKEVTLSAGQSLGANATGDVTSFVPQEGVTTYTADGALIISDGTHVLAKGSAGAFTLASPTTAQIGTTMVITAGTAFAHTVTLTAGFNGGGTATDVATFGAAVGDTLTINAVGTNWLVQSARNVVLA